jgi:hypothetical protein
MLLLRTFLPVFFGDNAGALLREGPALRPSAMFSLSKSVDMFVVQLSALQS